MPILKALRGCPREPPVEQGKKLGFFRDSIARGVEGDLGDPE